MVGRGLAGVTAGRVACRVERGDPEQPQDQPQPLGGGVVGERRQLLLLGEHRGPEGAVVHAEHRLDVALGVADSLGHDQPVAASLEAGRWS